jgi:TonB family protein
METPSQILLLRKCGLLACVVGAGLLWPSRESMAQGIPPQATASAAQPASPDGAPSESARRQALSPFRFILRNAESQQKPKRKEISKAPPSNPEAPLRRPSESNASTSPAIESTSTRPQNPGSAAAASTATEILELTKVTASVPKPLIPIAQDPPVLTASLQREVSAGKVTVAFEIRPAGDTGDIRIVSTSNRRLNAAVISAVSRWRFQPIDDARLVEVDFEFEEP